MKNILKCVLFITFLTTITQNTYSQDDPVMKITPKKAKYGFIDTTGREVIIPNYDEIGSFRGGLVPAMKNNKHYYLDKLGKVALTLDSIRAEGFSGTLSSFRYKDKYGFINKKGAIVHNPEFDNVRYFSNKNGLIQTSLNGKYGFINQLGIDIIPAKYNEVRYYEEGIVVSLNNKYGCIDVNGKELVPTKYDKISGLSEGLLCAKLGNSWGIIDLSNKIIVPFKLKYDFVEEFVNGYARMGRMNKFGMISKAGTEIIAPKYDEILYMSKEGTAVFRSNDKYGLLNNKGYEIVPPKYESMYTMYNGISRVSLKGLQGYVNIKGEEFIPLQYLAASDFVDYVNYQPVNVNISRVNVNYKYGFINSDGKMIIPAIYEQTQNINEGKIAVCLNKKWGFIDNNNKEITVCKYESVGDYKNGFAKISLNGKWGFVNDKGFEVVPPRYQYVSNFSEGFAMVIVE